MKKCQFSIVNVITIFGFLFLIVIILHLVSSRNSSKIEINNTSTSTEKSASAFALPAFTYASFNFPYNNLARDVLLDPYAAPLRDERYIVPQINMIPTGTVPINISTNIGSVDTTYRQVGILTPVKGGSTDKVLPLMGRPVLTTRDMWQYYCISNQHNNVKLPIRVKGKNASNEYGVQQIYGGDIVYVEGANEAYKTTIYENDVIKYLPFI